MTNYHHKVPAGFDWKDWRDVLDEDEEEPEGAESQYEGSQYEDSSSTAPRLTDWQRQEMGSGRWRVNTAPARMDNMSGNYSLSLHFLKENIRNS